MATAANNGELSLASGKAAPHWLSCRSRDYWPFAMHPFSFVCVTVRDTDSCAWDDDSIRDEVTNKTTRKSVRKYSYFVLFFCFGIIIIAASPKTFILFFFYGYFFPINLFRYSFFGKNVYE